MSDTYILDKLIQGSFDMHIHPAPDVIPMRVDVLEAAEQAKAAGMRGIVLKSHFYPTAPLAEIVRKLIPDIGVYGAICMDYEVGGLNHFALEASAKLGAKVVWMPTLCSVNSRRKMKAGGLGLNLEGDGFSILDDSGKLDPEIPRILEIVGKYDMVLASGHITPAEVFALVEEARKTGVKKMVVTHASNADVVDEALSLEDQQKLAGMGAYIEHAAADIMPCDFGHNPREIAEIIKATGPEHCILSSDAGMAQTLYPTEAMRVFIGALMRYGITEDEVEQMIKKNPAWLLGAD